MPESCDIGGQRWQAGKVIPTLFDPVRHPVKDFFLLDMADVSLRDDMTSMEFPIYALTADARKRNLVYDNGDHILRVVPSGVGVPSMFDKDIMIYCISQLVARKNQGLEIGNVVEFHLHDVLKTTNRATGGADYQRLIDGLRRLRGTTYETNIKTNEEEGHRGVGLIEEYWAIRKTPVKGRMLMVRVKLSDWVLRAVHSNDVLKLHPDYFRLKRPLDRRLYELARKHCGKQGLTQIGLAKLKEKIGSKAPLTKFRHNIKGVAETNHLPEYMLYLEGDIVTFSRRPECLEADQRKSQQHRRIASKGQKCISREALDKARAFAPEWDVEWLRKRFFEWRVSEKMEEPDNWNGAFLGWVKSFTKGKTPQQHQVMRQPLEPLGD